MTAQGTDTIIINDVEHIMYGLPLEQYWQENDNRPLLFSLTSSLGRGYIAKWLIEKKGLYLIDFYGESIFPPPPKEYSLIDLFPLAEKKIFAEWFSGDITIPMGKQVDYYHYGWGATYEYNTTIKFYNGFMIDSGLFVLE